MSSRGPSIPVEWFPLLGLLQLSKLPQNQFSTQRTQMTDKQPAVTMVSLMKEATRRQSTFLALESFSLGVLRVQERALGAFELRRYFGNRETAFLPDLFAGDRNNFRIRGDQFDSVTIHDKQTQRQTDLLRR